MSAVIPDYFIRMRFSELNNLTLKQDMVWTDADLLEEILSMGITASAAGYCECSADAAGQTISLGWSWFRTAEGHIVKLAPGGINTNLMLRNVSGYDLGQQATEEILMIWLTDKNWQDFTDGLPNECLH